MPIDKHIINANLEAEGIINAQLDKSGYTEDETSVMAGKAAIAASITNKGVPADKTDSFHQLSEKVSRITSGGDATALSELTDVEISAPTAGQVLVFDDTEDTWINGDVENSSEQVISMADYLALTDAERNNGTSYYIYDAVNEGREIQPVIYSLEEREIGVWTDGKPLYQKTYIVSSLTKGSWTQIENISNLNIDELVKLEGSYKRIWNSSDGYALCPIGYFESTEIRGTARFRAGRSLEYYIGDSSGNTISNIRCTIQYTKTTDTAGSGIWTTTGVPAVHYDGNEKVIGTWFGETLYEKTINCGAISHSGNTSINHNISNFNKLISASGVCTNNNGIQYPLPLVQNGNVGTDYQIKIEIGTNVINLSTVYATDIVSSYVTLRYTKATL